VARRSIGSTRTEEGLLEAARGGDGEAFRRPWTFIGLYKIATNAAQVKGMTAFMTPQVFPRFGLPETLSPDVG
jgi:hypothetical protein